VDLSPARAMVHADASMIEQVILNLAVNARDAMPRGGSLTLRTTIERIGPEAVTDGVDARAGMFVRLAMRDTGCGISPEHLPHIFEPFFTTKHVDRGTGLGLATVYGIVQQHGGWVDVNSCVGAGTTFDVYFPLHAGAAPTPVISPVGGADVIGHETILIVEDDEPVRRIARMLLERRGYRVLEAESGPAALAHCGEHRGTLDLVVTDMVLPGGLSGLELAAQLRTIWPNLDTILTSGYSVDLAGKEFRPPEHVHFLPKPYSATHLLNAVRATLDLRGSRIPEST
jgi:two-component system cell cycle sensor histidine kinase/response regulator CckA